MSADLNPLAHDALLATPAAGGAEFRALTDDGRPSAVTTGAVAPIQRTHEIVFVDPRVPDRAQLLAELTAQAGEGRHFEIITLDPNRPGIAQVTEALKGKVQVDAIHFITHGTDGAVQLGGTWLDAKALGANSEAVAKWGDSLKADADILFYGCDLTETARGRALVDWIAELTRADVAASNDATGSARLGGDWDLEYRTGEIDTPVVVSLPAQGEWDHLLPTVHGHQHQRRGRRNARQAILERERTPSVLTRSSSTSAGNALTRSASRHRPADHHEPGRDRRVVRARLHARRRPDDRDRRRRRRRKRPHARRQCERQHHSRPRHPALPGQRHLASVRLEQQRDRRQSTSDGSTRTAPRRGAATRTPASAF